MLVEAEARRRLRDRSVAAESFRWRKPADALVGAVPVVVVAEAVEKLLQLSEI